MTALPPDLPKADAATPAVSAGSQGNNAADRTSFHSAPDDGATTPAATSPLSGSSSAAAPGERLHVDPDRHEIHVRVSYATAIIVAVALLVSVVVAVLIGRSWGQGWPGLSQPATSDLLAGPPRPEVLQPTVRQGRLDFIDNDPAGMGSVGMPPRTPQTAEGGMARRTDAAGGVTDARPASDIASPPPAGSTSAQAVSGGQARTAAPSAVPAGRVVGINYFIVQSYPDERDARAVVDLLARHGIATTIERNLQGYPRWYIVVTTQGFTSLRSPEAEALRRRIDQISADQARVDRRWKPLTPQGYRWR